MLFWFVIELLLNVLVLVNGQFHGDGRTILTLYSSTCVTMMIDKVWLETSNIRVYERHPVIHLTKGAGYLAWFKVAI